jgi:hypothetical protein
VKREEGRGKREEGTGFGKYNSEFRIVLPFRAIRTLGPKVPKKNAFAKVLTGLLETCLEISTFFAPRLVDKLQKLVVE